MPQHRTSTVGGLLVAALLLGGCSGAASSEDDDVATSGGLPRADLAAPSSATTITLAFGGDVHFEGGLAGLPGREGATLGPMSKVLRSADLAMVNLESALTGRGAPASKELEDPADRYWFRSPPAALDLLERSGVDVVSVANNHGADYGPGGVRDTLRADRDSPVAVVGVGLDDTEAFAPHRVRVRDTDVAVLAADASPRESADATWAAAPGSGPGLASARTPAATAQLVSAVQEAAGVDDLVVVYLHWGAENDACPTGAQEALARSLSEAGADVVVGSHSHVSQGSGVPGDQPGGAYVSYGLGNFFWYHGRTSETGVLELRVRGDEVVSDQWVPARIGPAGGNPQPLTGAARTAAEADWRGLRGCTDLAPGPGAAADALPGFASEVQQIGPALARRMRSDDPAACPVPLGDLRRVALTYVGFDGEAHDGALVVHADVADDVVGIFASLYEARYPIRRMRLVEAYAGDDDASMAANNTSGYNCRRVAGSTGWSDHAYGRAIDLNPVQNPYVLGGRVRPPAGRPFVSVDRAPGAQAQPGVIRRGGVVASRFARSGWTWGGTYDEPDFQHFSAG